MTIDEINWALKNPESMTPEMRLAVFQVCLDRLHEFPECLAFVRSMVRGAATHCPPLLLKELGELIAKHQQCYLAGDIDGDGLPTY